MANKNFIVHNGLTVGSSTIDATTGNANVSNLIATAVYTDNYKFANGTAFSVDTSQILNGNSNVKVAANSDVTVAANGAVRMTVAANGNVGIANIAPAHTLSVTGTMNISGNANVGNLGTTTAIITTANITTINSALYQNGTSNVTVNASGNVNISVGGNILTVTSTGANVAGTANVTGNLLAGANIVYTGNLYQGAQLRYAHAYTASTAAPAGSTVGDYWYDTATDILYLRVSDGATSLWFDVSSQANTFADTTTTNATITTATITTANVSGNINAANLQNGTSNLRIVASGNISASVGGTANVAVWTTTGVVLANANVSGYANITGAANIGTTLGVTGNANVGNLGTATAIITTGNLTTINSGLLQNGNSNVTITANSNVTIAVTAANSYTFATGSFAPSSNATVQLGLTGARWSNIWGLASSAQYADLSERYASDSDYDPGTVVIFGGNAEITVTNADHDPRIAGVISTNPGYLMNDSADQDALMLPVALTGRVPTRVRGPISKGDMVVSSTEEGVAIRMSKALYEPGCVIGKSLENIADDSIQTIEVVVGRL